MASTAASPFKSRKVDKNLLSREQGEGMGARVRRTIGRPELRSFDPFLMLDEFSVAAPGGFPDHPHRGFETVTYLLPQSEGGFMHEDFKGHKGTIHPGDLQWMTAGRGIVHCEMPIDHKVGRGLQLWINLPSHLKMTEPRYQELPKEKLVKVTRDGVTAIVIAGKALGVESPVYTHVPTYYVHFMMDPHSKLQTDLPIEFNTFLYSIEGEGFVGSSGDKMKAHHVATLDRNGQGLEVTTKEARFEFVMVSGKPIGEKVVQQGPFVMNTQEEIMQTFEDYQEAKNGFENAKNWQSELAQQRRR